jgi:hypothetical protein
MDMYILTKGHGLEWHMYFLIDQLDYNGLFDYIYISVNLVHNAPVELPLARSFPLPTPVL